MHSELLGFAIARLRFLKTREKLLLSQFISSEADFLKLDRNRLSRLIGRNPVRADWDVNEVLRQAGEDERILTRRKISYTFYWDGAYPPQLREIFDPPFLLFRQGRLPSPDRPLAAVVGTRKPNGKGKNAAFLLGLEFGRLGVAVVSGLARGIDKAAHEGNLHAGCGTVAVIGNGIDTVYPRENRELGRLIVEGGGCILSEYPPGTPALRYNFPERNRIISGLVRSVVVVQAPERSGALITAEYALDQGRDVFIHRSAGGSEDSPGTRRLEADGAPAIEHAEEVVGEWEGVPVRTVPAAYGRIDGNNASDDAGTELARMLEEELSGKVIRYDGEFFRSNDGG